MQTANWRGRRAPCSIRPPPVASPPTCSVSSHPELVEGSFIKRNFSPQLSRGQGEKYHLSRRGLETNFWSIGFRTKPGISSGVDYAISIFDMLILPQQSKQLLQW